MSFVKFNYTFTYYCYERWNQEVSRKNFLEVLELDIFIILTHLFLFLSVVHKIGLRSYNKDHRGSKRLSTTVSFRTTVLSRNIVAHKVVLRISFDEAILLFEILLSSI